MRSTARWILVGLLAVGWTGCADQELELVETTDCTMLPDPYHSPGAQSDMDLAAMVPGYAGFYLEWDEQAIRDAQPRPIVGLLTDLVHAGTFEQALREYLVDEQWSGELSFVRVPYGYLQLLGWKAFFFNAPGWGGLGVDILDNAVEVGVPDEESAAEILRITGCRSIPTDAVDIVYGTVGEDGLD